MYAFPTFNYDGDATAKVEKIKAKVLFTTENWTKCPLRTHSTNKPTCEIGTINFSRCKYESTYKPKNVELHWKTGNPVETLIKICQTFEIDLLLLGALKREKMLKYYLGSIARQITRKAPCSVLLTVDKETTSSTVRQGKSPNGLGARRAAM